MSNSRFFLSTVDRLLSWARANSLWYRRTGISCCADEFFSTIGCRYDLERFGCQGASEPSQADLLVVSGAVTQKAAPELRKIYDQMLGPKYVMALGSCAAKGGAFGSHDSYSVVQGLAEILPVDVYVGGCPPRPEAIMNGLITLQEKIVGQ